MSVKAIPEGCTTVTPWIISRETAAVIDYIEGRSAPRNWAG
ncbi:hypothetical protein ACFFX1_24245 [Dactylosporangium sucinum]|nr:hypothetical protein [Dactylosporangium sucinum]